MFVKIETGGKILIISLYVDDLIFTSNDAYLIEEFKCSMKSKFEMTDLGKMRYFLGVEVLQSSNGIHLCQKKYTKDVLDRFGMRECNSVKKSHSVWFKADKRRWGEESQCNSVQTISW